MKRQLVFILTLAGLLAAWTPVWADEAFRREVQGFFDRVATAFDQKNLEGVTATAVPKATLKPLTGPEITVEEWVAAARKDMDNTKTIKSRFQVEQAAALGDGGWAAYTETHDFTLFSDPGHNYRMISRWRVILVRTAEGLRAKHFVQLTGAAYKDGQLFLPTANRKSNP
ncbi:MAG: nuclear transport factor 2 family protein [Deltaproteobacteria bacterium]|nr:nuclear transport factor 2 family protein [Deltaproteobacteria bacterium]